MYLEKLSIEHPSNCCWVT